MNADDATARNAYRNAETAMLRAGLGAAMTLVLVVLFYSVYRLLSTCLGACAGSLVWMILAGLMSYLAVVLLPLIVSTFEYDGIALQASFVAYRALRWGAEAAFNATRS